ncbi:MAG: hypothetical protein Q4E29_01440 [Lachnospiraceae bacterium]|nr:hypothetical protein [Lachnospiraceae bacterium]
MQVRIRIPENKIKKRKEVQKMKKFKKRTLVVCLIAALILPSLRVTLSARAEAVNEDNDNGTDEVMEHLQDAQEQDGTLTYDEDQVIWVRSNEDLKELAKNCTLDTWSRDKVVILDADLDFTSEGITLIPTFGGIFLGQGHTIKGFAIEGTSNNIGFFRYIQETGQVWNLNIQMDATAGTGHSGIGILAGQNKGLISGCSVNGTMNVNNDAGLLVGINEVSGIIEDSTVDGMVSGNHRVGGLVGTNKGGITGCTNNALVNTNAKDNKIDIQSLTLDEILSTENAASVTDIGGIAGSNEGVILYSTNNGSVGYQHVGYNIGGIAGSQTGFIMSCENHGRLNGRKDVGGIAGQMEPSSRMEYEEDTMEKLSREFPVLHDLVTKMDNDASDMSSALSTQIDELLNAVEGAQNAVNNIMSDVSSSYGDLSNSFSITELKSPDPVSLEFMKNLPSPSISIRPTETPSPTATPTPSTPASSPAPSKNPGETGNGGNGSGNGGNEISGENQGVRAIVYDLRDSKEEITYQIPHRLSEPSQNVPETGNVTQPQENQDDNNNNNNNNEFPSLPAIPTPSGGYDFPTYNFWDQIDWDAVENEINETQQKAYENANRVISDAEGEVRNQADRVRIRVESARNSLSSSFTNILDQTRTLNHMSDDYNQLLLDDLQAINDEIQVITNIITDTDTPETDEIFMDVSDDDTVKDTEGKVLSCINYGKISGDLNVGGIAGTMSRENNLDPEDDLNLSSDNTTLNVRYKERIVIRECINSGKVEGKKECAGGIVGEMTLGSIISGMNTGSVSSDEDKVGGIAGESMGTIRQSSSKCALSGDNQIGGIAGNGKTITDCYSMVEIQDGTYYLGSIAGQIDDSGTVENNYFVEGCPPGIDGISLAGEAQPVSYDEFLELPDMPEAFRSIHLTFMADDSQVARITINYGESFDVTKLPEVPQKDGYSGVWEDFSQENITFDQTIEAVYTEYITTLEADLDGAKLSRLLAEGTFDTDDTLEIKKVELYPEDAETRAESYQVRLETSDIGKHLYRFLPDASLEMENPSIEIYKDKAFVPVETEQDGSYLVFEYEDDVFTFTCVDRPSEPIPVALIAVLAGGCLVVIFVLIIGIHGRKKKKKAV